VYARNCAEEKKMTAQDELPLALRAAYLALHRRSDSQFSQQSITADQFVLLMTLARGDVLTQRELARRMPSDPSTVRAMLVLLERQGLVRRDAHPTDSRARTVALTAAGKRKFRQLWTESESIRTQMLESLKPDEVETLVRCLKRVTESLNNERVPFGESISNHD
jgi:DNA-binding MarR family transcriptional regulator